VAEVDVPGEAVVGVLEARAGLTLGEAEAVDGATVRGVGLRAEEVARVAGEVHPLGAAGTEVGELLGGHGVQIVSRLGGLRGLGSPASSLFAVVGGRVGFGVIADDDAVGAFLDEAELHALLEG